MEKLFTPSNIIFAIGIIGTIFTIYRMFHDPQVALDKQQDMDKQEVDGKAVILEERAKWDRDQSERRFTELGVRLDGAFTLAQNHTHTVDVKVDALIGVVNAMNLGMTKELTRLGTIIEERFPQK